MEPKQEKGSFMEKLAQFIVDKRNLFFLLYIAAMIFCIFSMNWKKVETDITLYLNEESETRQGLATMNEHFAMFSSASRRKRCLLAGRKGPRSRTGAGQ